MGVTVVLPVFNGLRTLEAAVDSILSQDELDLELLLIDDASTDGSGAMVRGYARRDARVTALVHQENLGLPRTLNEGLERARYEFVARMDADDEALPQRLGVQKTFLESNENVAVVGSWVFHMGKNPQYDRLVRLPTEHDEIVKTLVRENCIYHPSVMMRRSIVLEAGGYRPEFKNAEDYDLWLRLARTHKLRNVAEPLLRYRFSVDGQTLGRKWEQLFYILLAQAAGRNPDLPFDELSHQAREILIEFDRREFLTQVMLATLREVLALHQWHDAWAVTRRLAKDADPWALPSLAAEMGLGRLRSAKAVLLDVVARPRV
jgi:glycosyltransferase involved in cell wall biosynthesis